jgi:hypothetical protein
MVITAIKEQIRIMAEAETITTEVFEIIEELNKNI